MTLPRAHPDPSPAPPPRTEAAWRFDLLRIPWLHRLVRWRGFQPLLQAPFVLVFLFLIYTGLFEYPNPGGLTVILTWILWWAGIVFVVAFLGKFWCTVCPWNAIADWLNRLSPVRRVPRARLLSAGRPWPHWLRNLWLATTCFIVLVWLELLPGLDMVVNPRATAIVALVMLGFSIASVLLFDRSAFCRYGCLVGRISGLYSMVAPFELRARDRDACHQCATKDCYQGNDRGYPCPTWEFPQVMDRNTYCILCTECVKTCPHGNIAFNVRPFGADLWRLARVQADEAWLALFLVSVTLFHLVTMAPAWPLMERLLRAELGMHRMAAYTLLMAALLAAPVAVHLAVTALSARWGRTKGVTARDSFLRFAYSLLPVALLGHMAHNTEHLLDEGAWVIPALTDPLNRGWDLLSLGAAFVPRPLLGAAPLEVLKLGMVATGLLAGALVAGRAARALYGASGPRRVLAGFLPVLAAILLVTAFQVWVLSQPMVSRLGLG